MKKAVTKDRNNPIKTLLNTKERKKLLLRVKGLLVDKKPDPLVQLRKMRKEWQR